MISLPAAGFPNWPLCSQFGARALAVPEISWLVWQRSQPRCIGKYCDQLQTFGTRYRFNALSLHLQTVILRDC